MDTEKRESSKEVENRPEDRGANNGIWSGCCGPEMAEADQMRRTCPCASMFRGSRGSIFVLLGVAGLLFSTIVTGWVLGVVGFFRTI